MNLALIGSLMLAGLLGSGHCLAMCGGIHATLGQRASSASAALWLQAGRVIGYAALGALASALGSAMFSFMNLAPVIRPLWIVANLLAVATGLTLLVFARQPRWLDALGDRFAGWAGLAGQPARPQPVLWHPKAPTGAASATSATSPASAATATPAAPATRALRKGRLLLTGAAWALLPCGFLYSAVLLVLVSADPLTGAAAMAGFAAATAIPLLLAQRLGRAAANGAASRASGAGSVNGASRAGASRAGAFAALDRYLGARGLGALITMASVYGIYMIASGHADRLFCRTV